MGCETVIEIRFREILLDTFDDGVSDENKEKAIELHIKEFCKEHKIDRQCIDILQSETVDDEEI